LHLVLTENGATFMRHSFPALMNINVGSSELVY
jgi:hypothetical protein